LPCYDNSIACRDSIAFQNPRGGASRALVTRMFIALAGLPAFCPRCRRRPAKPSSRPHRLDTSHVTALLNSSTTPRPDDRGGMCVCPPSPPAPTSRQPEPGRRAHQNPQGENGVDVDSIDALLPQGGRRALRAWTAAAPGTGQAGAEGGQAGVHRQAVAGRSPMPLRSLTSPGSTSPCFSSRPCGSTPHPGDEGQPAGGSHSQAAESTAPGDEPHHPDLFCMGCMAWSPVYHHGPGCERTGNTARTWTSSRAPGRRPDRHLPGIRPRAIQDSGHRQQGP